MTSCRTRPGVTPSSFAALVVVISFIGETKTGRNSALRPTARTKKPARERFGKCGSFERPGYPAVDYPYHKADGQSKKHKFIDAGHPHLQPVAHGRGGSG